MPEGVEGVGRVHGVEGEAEGEDLEGETHLVESETENRSRQRRPDGQQKGIVHSKRMWT